jgi:hypothetical protein
MLMSSAKDHVGLERTFGKHPAAVPPRMQLRYRGIINQRIIGNPLHIEH